MRRFNEYKQLNLASVSKEILEQWEKEDLFHKSIETREGNPSFLFFEGPPSANGMPGIHHVMARTIKDTFCRFKTMQGYTPNTNFPPSTREKPSRRWSKAFRSKLTAA